MLARERGIRRSCNTFAPRSTRVSSRRPSFSSPIAPRAHAWVLCGSSDRARTSRPGAGVRYGCAALAWRPGARTRGGPMRRPGLPVQAPGSGPVRSPPRLEPVRSPPAHRRQLPRRAGSRPGTRPAWRRGSTPPARQPAARSNNHGKSRRSEAAFAWPRPERSCRESSPDEGRSGTVYRNCPASECLAIGGSCTATAAVENSPHRLLTGVGGQPRSPTPTTRLGDRKS